jgi:hypothetical protein
MSFGIKGLIAGYAYFRPSLFSFLKLSYFHGGAVSFKKWNFVRLCIAQEPLCLKREGSVLFSKLRESIPSRMYDVTTLSFSDVTGPRRE